MPDLDYSNLPIADGGTASVTFARIAADALALHENEAALREDLLRYCEKDTRALAELHRYLDGHPEIIWGLQERQ